MRKNIQTLNEEIKRIQSLMGLILENEEEKISDHKIKLYTNPEWRGIGLGENPEKEKELIDSLPVTDFEYDGENLVGFEYDSKMDLPKSKENVERMMSKIEEGGTLPPLLIRKYGNKFQVLDGHHRFWAYKQLSKKDPKKYNPIVLKVKIVPDENIEETDIIPDNQ